MANIPEYRKFVGSQNNGHFESQGFMTLKLLKSRGLKPHHKTLDVGCGSLRHGRTLIPMLDYGNYFGIEPAKEILEMGIEKELGSDTKGARFDTNGDFNLEVFGVKFDFIFSMNVFIHCSPRQLADFLNSAQKVTGPESKIILNVNISDGCGQIARKPRQRYQHADHVACWYNEQCVYQIFGRTGFAYELIRRNEITNSACSLDREQLVIELSPAISSKKYFLC